MNSNTRKKVELVRRDIDPHVSLCLMPEETGDRKWEIKVLSVCTDQSPLLENWKMALDEQGYDHEVLGLGEKWGGWKWRTRQYIRALASSTEEKLFVLTDATDLFFIRGPGFLAMNFKSYRSDVVIGAEHQCCTGWPRWNANIKEQILTAARARNPWTRYIVPNGGFVMGWRTPLLNVLCANLEEDDDQHGYLVNWLEHPEVMKLDIYARLVANIVYDLPFMDTEDDERVEMDFFPVKGKIVKSTETNSMPIALHFAGGNAEAYNYYGTKLYGEKFNVWSRKPDMKSTIKYTLKKSWTQDIKANIMPSFLSGSFRFLGKNE